VANPAAVIAAVFNNSLRLSEKELMVHLAKERVHGTFSLFLPPILFTETQKLFVTNRTDRVFEWSYNLSMARGWESKSVEDQIQEREAAASSASHSKLSPEEVELKTRREGLQMARTRTLSSLQSACDARYRSHLERVLADLDAQLRALESNSTT
jgi:hypothetical protein